MTLSALIHKTKTRGAATLTDATTATQITESGLTVAIAPPVNGVTPLVSKNDTSKVTLPLSDLIHKPKKRRSTTTATEITEAKLTVATLPESKTDALTVVVSTSEARGKTQQKQDIDPPKWLLELHQKPAAHILETTVIDEDDRRHCADCANLTDHGRCLAAWRGQIRASKLYTPIDTLPRRCVGFSPKASDTDRRTGVERWPTLNEQGNKMAM